MPTINLVSGGKGGVGKSMVARTLTQYFLDRHHPFAAFDTDRMNPDLARIHNDICHLAILSEGEKYLDGANAIYNVAATKDAVVNCPAQDGPALIAWIESNELLLWAKEDDITFQLWFVTDGGMDSLKILHRSLDRFGCDIRHILVRNWGMSETWSLLEGDAALQEKLLTYGMQTVDFPRLYSTSDCQKIDTLSLTFGEARTYKDFSLITRNRVRSFLRKAYAEFDAVLSST